MIQFNRGIGVYLGSDVDQITQVMNILPGFMMF
jgi:hypothetical protein